MTELSLSTMRAAIAERVQVTIAPNERFTPTIVNAAINEAIEAYHLCLVDAGAPQRERRTTLTTTSSDTASNGWPGNQFVALPTDFLQLRYAAVLIDAREYGLTPYVESQAEDMGTWFSQSTGMPTQYRISEGTDGAKILRLLPAADDAYTIVVVYTPLIAQLDSDNDTFDFFPGTQDYVICDVAMKLLEGDDLMGQQYSALSQRKAEAYDRLKRHAAKQDRAGVKSMVDTRRRLRRRGRQYFA